MDIRANTNSGDALVKFGIYEGSVWMVIGRPTLLAFVQSVSDTGIVQYTEYCWRRHRWNRYVRIDHETFKIQHMSTPRDMFRL